MPIKIGFFYKGRPDLAAMIPDFVDPVIVDAQADGTYAPADLAALAECEAVIVSTEPITEQVYAAMPKLKIVQRMGVGYDNVDLQAGARHGVPCCNLQGVNKEAVAEHGMMMILGVARRAAWNHNNVAEGKWERALRWDTPQFELPGKTLGIVGLGNTGFELAKRAYGHDMKIVYNDIREIDPERVRRVQATFMEKDDLFRESDVVSINTDLNDQSRNLCDARRLALMKPSAILVCCARGGIIDEPALAEALNSGRIAGAGLDVFQQEPVNGDNPLLTARNTLLSPHIAGVTAEAVKRAYDWAYENVQRAVNDQQPKWIVNGVGG